MEIGFGIVFPGHHDVHRHIAEQPELGVVEFPKRAYSVGSRADIQKPKAKHHLHGQLGPRIDQKNDGRSSSAPHLISEHAKKCSPHGSLRGSPLGSCSPALSAGRSRRSSRDDPELFAEMTFDRAPRAASDAYRAGSDAYRPRTSSWGQCYRPRANSHAGKVKRAGAADNMAASHARSSSQELVKPSARHGRTGSSESLRKLHYVDHAKRHHDYAEIPDHVTAERAGAGPDASDYLSMESTDQIRRLAESMNEMALQYTDLPTVRSAHRGRGCGLAASRSRAAPPPPMKDADSRVSLPIRDADSRAPRPIRDADAHTSRAAPPIKDEDSYAISEPVNVLSRNYSDGIIPRMVDVWTPQIQAGDDDEDEYACLNKSS